MAFDDLIPVIVGVTGHRNIVDDDKQSIREQIKNSLEEIRLMCKGKDGNPDTPIVMLNGMAQGADMLCAEVAFELQIPVCAVLPCAREQFYKSFDPVPDRDKLFDYLDRCARVIYAPDIEQNREWFRNEVNMDDDSYGYRQVGVYMAEHAHIMIALWDGKQPKGNYGCGTVEVIKFTLENNFLSRDRLFKPGIINDSAVIWIKARRQGDGAEADVKKQWLIGKNAADEDGVVYDDYLMLTAAPEFLTEMINKTAAYNAAELKSKKTSRICKRKKSKQNQEPKYQLWKDVEQLDEYRKSLRKHYIKADKLSYSVNQPRYNRLMLALAIIGTLIAMFFLIYDDASLPYMIYPCSVAVIAVILIGVTARNKKYHSNYIEYRAFAEALRIQFYLSLCLNEAEGTTNVCELYAWSQKTDFMWIHRALQALDVICSNESQSAIDVNTVRNVWIGNSPNPKGQLCYHNDKKEPNKKQQKKFDNASRAFRIVSITVYFAILLIEIIAEILKACNLPFFWEGNVFGNISWRSAAAIAVGTVAALSLLLSSYWGKKSYDRLYDDNKKMSQFYSAACARWEQVAKMHYTEAEFARFVKEIAREELVENGIWCSYVAQNTLDINL